MFIKLFNWLIKRTPYCFAIGFLSKIWGILAAFFGLFFVIVQLEYESFEILKLFIYSFTILVIIVSLFCFLRYGLLRKFLGKKYEKKEFRILNDNILKGHFRPNISAATLLESLESLKKINLWIGTLFIQVSVITISGLILIDRLANEEFKNVLVILIGGCISMTIGFICILILSELLSSPVRKECKMLLAAKGKYFENSYFLTLRTKSKFFIVVMGLALAIVLSLSSSLNPTLIIFSISALIIAGLLSELIFKSIYNSLMEIEESTKKLIKRKKVSFCTGSLDKEIIDLSENLNLTANEIYITRQALEEEKTSLEIKVNARTRELKELTQSLDQKVKQRTKELQDRVDELERFHKLTVGREVKMIELKKEIKELKKIHPVK
ncbi:hypothetical protein KAS79_00255 [Candidatus Parcubacteria bacterium]|nr:hypothetical protein [Candidatus Parcubacteria bacterium]